MVNDVISDSLTRIRNAGMRRMETATLIFSKSVESIVKIFQEKGYVESYSVIEDGNKKSISVVLKYDDKGFTVINEIKRVSKPGRRVYKKSADIKRFKNGYGTIIVSTSKGVIDNDKAHELGVGGEVLCTIW
jgi:small subunit ribosomal protein S8